MTCKDCDHLLSVYERTVRLYTNAARSIAGAIGEDFTLALARAEKLRAECQAANEELIRHWRSSHHRSPVQD